MLPAARRTLLLTLLGLTTAGCLERHRGGEIAADVVAEPPSAVEPVPYPQSDLDDPYITDAATKAVEEQGSAAVTVPGEDFPALEATYEQLSQDGHNPHIEYEDAVLKLTLVKYE